MVVSGFLCGSAGVGNRDLMPEPGELGGQRGAHVPGPMMPIRMVFSYAA
jgi:hypothetical protein